MPLPRSASRGRSVARRRAHQGSAAGWRRLRRAAGDSGLRRRSRESAASGAPEPALSLPKGLASETCEVKTPPASAPGLDAEKREGKTAPTTSQPEQEQVALSPVLWLDPDVRWLCGVHEAEGHFYLVRERYEELLWWLLMPALLRLAGEAAPSRAAVEELSKTVAAALHSAEAAGYRVNTLLGPLAAAGCRRISSARTRARPTPSRNRTRAGSIGFRPPASLFLTHTSRQSQPRVTTGTSQMPCGGSKFHPDLLWGECLHGRVCPFAAEPFRRGGCRC